MSRTSCVLLGNTITTTTVCFKSREMGIEPHAVHTVVLSHQFFLIPFTFSLPQLHLVFGTGKIFDNYLKTGNKMKLSLL